MGTCSSAEVVESDTLTALPTFKIAIVGDSQTGKTAIFNRFVKHCYYKDYIPTKKVEIVNVIKKVNVPDHMIVSLTLWDTPGRDDIDLTDTYFSHIDAAIVVVDVTSHESMEMAGYWKQQVINTVTRNSDMSTADALRLPIILLGNKYDLVDKEKPYHSTDVEIIKDDSTEKMEDSDDLLIAKPEEEWRPECVEKVNQLADRHGFLSGVMVSAKESDGSVHQAMQMLIRNLMDANLDKLYGPNYRRKERKRKKVKVSDAGVDTSLALTGVETIDAYITECEEPVQRITELKSSYEESLHNLKLACADAELIPAEHYTKATLEQCMTALKYEIGEDLMTEENSDTGMVTLLVTGKEQPRGYVSKAMDRFNKGLEFYNEYAVICGIILIESDSLQNSLKKLDQKILKSQSEVWENERAELNKDNNSNRVEGSSQHDFKVVSSTVESNRVQIAESLLWIQELHKHSERARDKVSTALMW